MLPPDITVLIPTIGRRDYILDSVKSVLNSRIENGLRIEILISENLREQQKHDDDLQNFLENKGLWDSRILVRREPQHISFSAHLNQCIRSIRSEFMFILCDDDFIHPDAIQWMYNAINSSDNVGVALTEQEIISENSKLDDFFGKHTENRSSHSYELKVFEGLHFFQHNFSPNGTKLRFGSYINFFARTQDVVKAGLFPHFSDGLHSDNYLLLKLITGRKIAVVRDGLVFYRSYLQSVGLSAAYVHLICATDDYLNTAFRFIGSREDMNLSEKTEFLSGLVSQAIRTLSARIPSARRYSDEEVKYFASVLTDARGRWKMF